MENDAQPPAADIATNDKHENGLREGLYTLRNKRARTFLDLGMFLLGDLGVANVDFRRERGKILFSLAKHKRLDWKSAMANASH